MIPFLKKSTVLTIIVFIIGLLIYSTVLKSFYLTILPVVLVFFYLVTNLVHAYLLKIAVKTSLKFTSQYMATSFLKMFFFLAVAIGYVIYNREDAKLFILNFLLLYIIYTGFEVYEFSKAVKQMNK